MRRYFTVLTAVFAVVAFSSLALAQAEKPKVEKAAKTEQATAKKAPAAAPAASGKVAKFDEATKTLTVTTKDGDKNFMVTADTKIATGAKALKAADLVAGKDVKVTYSEAGGMMTATKIAIAAEKAPAKKAEKK